MALIEQFNLPGTFANGQGMAPITRPDELAWPGEELDDETALKIVLQDKAFAERWVQTQGWSYEWAMQDRLYQFQVPKRTWDGTNVPRSHLGMPLVYEHVESLLPQLMSSIFGDDPPFLCEPRANTSADAARANRKLIEWQIEQIGMREEVRLGLKHMLIHGMGVWKRGWEQFDRPRTIYKREQPYKYEKSMLGAPIRMAQAGTSKKVKVQITERVNRPTFEHRSMRHVLFDPGLMTGNCRQGRFVIDVQYLTIAQLDKLRDYEGYNIPERDELVRLMFDPREVAKPNVLEDDQQLFGEFYKIPRSDSTTVDRLHQPLRVDEYWTKDRVCTVVQDKLIIRKEANPDGKIPFYSLAMADVLEMCRGIGVAEVIGNEQRMQQGVINAFLDDLALNINGMFVRKRGMDVRPNSLRMRPGGVIEVDDVTDVNVLKREPIQTGEIQGILQASDSRAAKRTAASETTVQGAMPSSNSSVTRTAAGVNSLSSGTGTRLQEIVERFCQQVFVPFLNDLHTANGEFLDPEDIDRILSEELGVAYEGDALDLLNGNFAFDMKAGARMQDKAAMRQTLPLLWQFLTTPTTQQGLQAQNQKVNVAELVNMTIDASGWNNKTSLIVPMSPQDIAKEQANSPAAQQQAKAQGQLQQTAQTIQLQTQAKSQIVEQENEARAARDIIREKIKQEDERATS